LSFIAAHVRDHSTAMICLVQKCNWLCCNVGCHQKRIQPVRLGGDWRFQWYFVVKSQCGLAMYWKRD